MPGINGDFFSKGIAANERKYTYLTPMDHGILRLTTVVIDTAGQKSDRTVVQYYDCVNMRLTDQP